MIEHLEGTYETISYKTDNGIKFYNNRSYMSYPFHWHTGIEIISPIDSTYFVQIDHDQITLEADDILIIAAGELHYLNATEEGARYILQIDYQRLSTQKDIRPLLNIMKPYYLLRAKEYPEFCSYIRGFFVQIEQEYLRADNFYQTSLFSLFEQMFVKIGRFHLERMNQNYQNQDDDSDSNMVSKMNYDQLQAPVKQTTNNHNIDQFLIVCDYINENYNMNPSLECAAMTTGYSKSHFCRFFKHFSGKSYYDYLLEVKISHAANDLTTTDKRITDIAMECGFNSVSTFNRVFQQHYHCKPSEYRNL